MTRGTAPPPAGALQKAYPASRRAPGRERAPRGMVRGPPGPDAVPGLGLPDTALRRTARRSFRYGAARERGGPGRWNGGDHAPGLSPPGR